MRTLLSGSSGCVLLAFQKRVKIIHIWTIGVEKLSRLFLGFKNRYCCYFRMHEAFDHHACRVLLDMGIIKIRYYSPDALRITEAQTSRLTTPRRPSNLAELGWVG